MAIATRGEVFIEASAYPIRRELRATIYSAILD
jgi:hypothetical protein